MTLDPFTVYEATKMYLIFFVQNISKTIGWTAIKSGTIIHAAKMTIPAFWLSHYFLALLTGQIFNNPVKYHDLLDGSTLNIVQLFILP